MYDTEKKQKAGKKIQMNMNVKVKIVAYVFKTFMDCAKLRKHMETQNRC
jgi:hypothetical protein